MSTASDNGNILDVRELTITLPDGRKLFRIGRVCTKQTARGLGHTTRLLRAALADVGRHRCAINAQTYLIEMYSGHGFAVDGDEFLEDGIPHVPMLRAQRP